MHRHLRAGSWRSSGPEKQKFPLRGGWRQKTPCLQRQGVEARASAGPWFHSPVLAGSWNSGEAGILALPPVTPALRPRPFKSRRQRSAPERHGSGSQLRDSAGLPACGGSQAGHRTSPFKACLSVRLTSPRIRLCTVSIAQNGVLGKTEPFIAKRSLPGSKGHIGKERCPSGRIGVGSCE